MMTSSQRYCASSRLKYPQTVARLRSMTAASLYAGIMTDKNGITARSVSVVAQVRSLAATGGGAAGGEMPMEVIGRIRADRIALMILEQRRYNVAPIRWRNMSQVGGTTASARG